MEREVKVVHSEDLEWMIGEGGWTEKPFFCGEDISSKKMEKITWVQFAPGTRHPKEKGAYDIRESDEVCIVICGTFDFYYKSKGKEIKEVMKEGDAVFIPVNSEYRWENNSAELARLISAIHSA